MLKNVFLNLLDIKGVINKEQYFFGVIGSFLLASLFFALSYSTITFLAAMIGYIVFCFICLKDKDNSNNIFILLFLLGLTVVLPFIGFYIAFLLLTNQKLNDMNCTSLVSKLILILSIPFPFITFLALMLLPNKK